MSTDSTIPEVDDSSSGEQEPHDHVVVLRDEARTIHLLGTAHVSRRSVDEVRALIARVRPDTVCVELDEMRHRALIGDGGWRDLDIFQVIREGKAPFLLANLALSSFQRGLGEKLGVEPGAEMLAAVEEAERSGAELVLADRNIQITLKRTWARLPWLRKLEVAAFGVESIFVRHDVTEEELEQLKERDHLTDMMREFAKALPEVKEPLIDERDLYLMSKVQEAPGQTIVAVVGAGHVEGMTAHFGKAVDRERLDTLPPPSRGWNLAKWIVPLVALALFYVGWSRHAGEGLQEMLLAWILPNSILAALFSAFAGAHVVSIVTAFFAAPITSLNPSLGAGMVVGLVEAWLRKPTVADCDRVKDDIRTLRGAYSNRITRVLLVFVASTLGSVLGTWIGITWLASLGSR